MESIFISPTDLSGNLGTKRNMYDILYVNSKWSWFQLVLVRLYLPLFDKTHNSSKKRNICKEKTSKYIEKENIDVL